jgi:hypothetical protein
MPQRAIERQNSGKTKTIFNKLALTIMDRKSRQEIIFLKTADLNDSIKEMDFTDIHKTVYPIAKAHILLKYTWNTLLLITLGHKISCIKF